MTEVSVGAAQPSGGSREVEVGKADDFPVGQFRIIQIGRREIGVIRLASGEWRAVLNWCPHRGAPVCKGTVGGTWPPCEPGELTFAKDGEVLVCPWHGYEFDLNTGEELFQTLPSRLRMFPASVRNGSVVIDLAGRHPRAQ